MPIPIRDCMKRHVISVTVNATLDEAVRLLVEKHVGTLPVVDDENKLVGMIGLDDLLSLFLPDFIRLMDNVDFVHDFGALEDVRVTPETRNRPVSEIMHEPVSVEETTGLLRASAMLLQHNIPDLPIVKPDGTLVGIASRVDIGTAFLATWGTGPLNPTETS